MAEIIKGQDNAVPFLTPVNTKWTKSDIPPQRNAVKVKPVALKVCSWSREVDTRRNWSKVAFSLPPPSPINKSKTVTYINSN